MAIDRNRLKSLLKDIEDVFDSVLALLPKTAKDWVREKVMGAALEELRKLVNDSRPPVLMLIGRSGHGKSSILNALAGKKVVEVGTVKPTTPEASAHLVSFPEKFASWLVIDTRGIFETSRPDGAPTEDATTVLAAEMVKRRPDVILHVISAPEVRALSNDLRVISKLRKQLGDSVGGVIPLVAVLSRPDTLGNPREWPPEKFPQKAAQLRDCLNYFATDALNVKSARTEVDPNAPYYGLEFADNETNVFAALPVFAHEEEAPWNIENLARIIGQKLPASAKLDFYQAQNRQKLLRDLSGSIINRFSGIAGIIGLSPVPFSDLVILTPLQMTMVATIAGLSCRELSLRTVGEFAAASGVNLGAGYTFRQVARQLLKVIPAPILALPLSGAVASAGTSALGKSAETYFFETAAGS
jgi:uncharacterized protein (DUF697 family)/predicted GTPase